MQYVVPYFGHLKIYIYLYIYLLWCLQTRRYQNSRHNTYIFIELSYNTNPISHQTNSELCLHTLTKMGCEHDQ